MKGHSTNADFYFKGLYQVQSRRQKVLSELGGKWIRDESYLSTDKVNRHLEARQSGCGNAVINIAGADVHYRTGLFASDPDILVKSQFFYPDEDSASLPCDLIDVQKATGLWETRVPYIKKLFKQAEDLLQMVDPLEKAIINEYFCHEAGHCFGLPVREKYELGFFRIRQQPVWPLIFTEEFRADLHSFGVAAALLDERSAIQVFIYNILLRFGVEASGIYNNKEAYGSVPFLLFSFLLKANAIFIDPSDGSISFSSLAPIDLVNLMQQASRHAEEKITVFDGCEDKSDTAIGYANYFRSIILDKETTDLYKNTLLSFKQ